jgi:hypothetical protein
METLSFVISFFAYLLIAFPICVVVHELGHAIMILFLTNQKTVFQFGTKGVKREILLGRITIQLYFEPSALFFCRYRLENKLALSRSQDFGITVGGPLASLIFGMTSGVVWWLSYIEDPWKGLALINLIIFLNTIIPGQYPEWQGAQAGIPSDGLQLLQLIRQSRTEHHG